MGIPFQIYGFSPHRVNTCNFDECYPYKFASSFNSSNLTVIARLIVKPDSRRHGLPIVGDGNRWYASIPRRFIRQREFRHVG